MKKRLIDLRSRVARAVRGTSIPGDLARRHQPKPPARARRVSKPSARPPGYDPMDYDETPGDPRKAHAKQVAKWRTSTDAWARQHAADASVRSAQRTRIALLSERCDAAARASDRHVAEKLHRWEAPPKSASGPVQCFVCGHPPFSAQAVQWDLCLKCGTSPAFVSFRERLDWRSLRAEKFAAARRARGLSAVV